MTGTEKQAAWAEDIKAAAYKNLELIESNRWKTMKDGTVEDLGYGHPLDNLDKEKVATALTMMKANLDKVFEQMTDASAIISRRANLTYDSLVKCVHSIARSL